MRVTLFKDDWYADYMNQELERHQDAEADAYAIASAIMTSGAFQAQAVDGLADEVKKCAQALEGIIDAMRDGHDLT